MKHVILTLMATALAAMAQTPDTNDVLRTTNTQLNYSTNQTVASVWLYRQVTNEMCVPILVTNIVDSVPVVTTNWPTLPTWKDWHDAVIREMAARWMNDLIRQRKEAEAAVKSFQDLRDKWPDLSPAQRAAVLNAAGL